jgi:hypothetical protein
MALGSTQPVTEMSTRNLPGGKERPVREADNLAAICELSRKCGSLDVSQPYGPSRRYLFNLVSIPTEPSSLPLYPDTVSNILISLKILFLSFSFSLEVSDVGWSRYPV